MAEAFDSILRRLGAFALPSAAADLGRDITSFAHGGPAPTPPLPADSDPRLAQAFQLSVDDAGQYFVALSEDLVLGHLRAGVADLGMLADIGPRHARLELGASLRAGAAWTIRPLEGERVEVNGAHLIEGASVLCDGDVVRLAHNLAFRFRQPDLASSSAVLELLHGAECAHAPAVLLFGAGPGARVRIGAGRTSHVRVPSLAHEFELVRSGGEIRVRGSLGFSGGEGEMSLACPPLEPVTLVAGKSAAGRPPFGISFAPLEPLLGSQAG